MAVGFLLPFSRPDKSPRSARGNTSPPPTVLEFPVWNKKNEYEEYINKTYCGITYGKYGRVR